MILHLLILFVAAISLSYLFHYLDRQTRVRRKLYKQYIKLQKRKSLLKQFEEDSQRLDSMIKQINIEKYHLIIEELNKLREKVLKETDPSNREIARQKFGNKLRKWLK